MQETPSWGIEVMESLLHPQDQPFDPGPRDFSQPDSTVESTLHQAFGVELSFPRDSSTLQFVRERFGGATELDEEIALGLEIGYRVAQIDEDVRKIRAGIEQLRENKPLLLGHGEWQSKFDELRELEIQLAVARHDLRTFFFESGLERLFRTHVGVDFGERIFSYVPFPERDSAGSRTTGFDVAVSYGAGLAPYEPHYASGHGLEHADFWIFFMPTSLVTGGGLRGLLAMAAKQGAKSAAQGLARVATREAFESALSKLSLRNVRESLVPLVRESLSLKGFGRPRRGMVNFGPLLPQRSSAVARPLVEAAEETFQQAVIAEVLAGGIPEAVRGFNIYGTKGLVGSTFNRNIWLIEAQQIGATSPRALLRAFEAEARAAGASKISIIGHSIINPSLLSLRTDLLQRLGWSLRQVNEQTIHLVKVLD